jgi:5-methylcytosine rRNA methyltransferase NSUN4
MNAASLLPVLALDPQPGDEILDACAAPGGKALFIHERLGGQGRLVANDLSPARRAAMARMFAEYGLLTPGPTLELRGEKAETIFRRDPARFDKILLDAPCSSEKHVFNSPPHLAEWSASRVRQLRERQYGLLSGLLLALKPGGRLVYSTCAVTPEENEAVLARLLDKKAGLASLEAPRALPANAPGLYGSPIPGAAGFDPALVRRILPHRHGLDPMFVAVLRREG